MLKKLKLLKKPLFQKRRWSCDFPPRKTRVAQKHRTISGQEKMAFSTPVGLTWHSPPPPRVLRTDGRTDLRTDGHVTISSQPKFLGLIGYQISLAMELRWRALPAGSANNPVMQFLGIIEFFKSHYVTGTIHCYLISLIEVLLSFCKFTKWKRSSLPLLFFFI